MINKAFFMAAFLLSLSPIFASGNDASEAGVATSPLSIYEGGISAGAFYALNDELRDQSEQFLKISFSNYLNVRNNMAVFIDADWFIPEYNFGAKLGFDFLVGSEDFKALIGAGVGANHFDKGEPFGKEVGASITAHAGFKMGLTEGMKIRVRVPYHLVLNSPRDQLVGLDVSFLFGSRWSHVKKLNYR